jgi:hypothetical protein
MVVPAVGGLAPAAPPLAPPLALLATSRAPRSHAYAYHPKSHSRTATTANTNLYNYFSFYFFLYCLFSILRNISHFYKHCICSELVFTLLCLFGWISTNRPTVFLSHTKSVSTTSTGDQSANHIFHSQQISHQATTSNIQPNNP